VKSYAGNTPKSWIAEDPSAEVAKQPTGTEGATEIEVNNIADAPRRDPRHRRVGEKPAVI